MKQISQGDEMKVSEPFLASTCVAVIVASVVALNHATIRDIIASGFFVGATAHLWILGIKKLTTS